MKSPEPPRAEMPGGTSRPKTPPLPFLTPPRFVAAFCVIVLHVWGGWYGTSSMPGFIRAGYLGVGFFFVLSGFILAYTYGNRQFGRGTFWGHRFARIYPAYLLGLAICLPAFVRTMKGYHAAGDAASMVLDPWSHLILVHSYAKKYHLSWNYAGWTLGVEAFFYAIFPFVIPWVKGLKSTGVWALLLGCWLVAFTRFLGPVDGWYWVRHPFGRTPEFVFGIALWVVYARMSEDRRRALGRPLALLGVAMATILFAAHNLFPSTSLDGGTIMPAWGVLIFGLACWPASENPSRLLKVTTVLGDASYSMYILQAGVIALLGFAGTKIGFLGRHPALNATLAVVAVAVAGLLSHHYVESRMRLRIRRWFDRKPVPSTTP